MAQGYEAGAGIHDFLAYLATVDPAGRAVAARRPEISGEYNVILTTRPHGAIPANLWACSYFIFIGTQN